MKFAMNLQNPQLLLFEDQFITVKVCKSFCIILHNISEDVKRGNIMKMYGLTGPLASLASSNTVSIAASFFTSIIVKHFISLHTDKTSKRKVFCYIFLCE